MMYSMVSSILNSIRSVVDDCIVSPLTRVMMALPYGSPNSSAVTTTGPMGPESSGFLPSAHCDVARWWVRALRSLKAV